MRTRTAFGLALSVVLLAGACGEAGPEGAYKHEEEGVITLSDGGTGTWEQEGSDPFKFEWEEKGDAIAVSAEGKELGSLTLDDDGNLVLPPDMISGDEDVTFERQ